MTSHPAHAAGCRRASARPPPPSNERWTRRWTGSLLLAFAGATGLGCKRPAPPPDPQPVASAAASASAANPMVELRFAARTPTVGEARLERFERELHIPPPAVEGRPVGPGLTLEESIERRVEIHSLNEDRVGGLLVEYRRVDRTRDGKSIADPRAGQRFLVRLRDGTLEVTSPEGAAVPTTIASLVGADHVFLEAAVPMARFLPEGPIPPGQVIEPSHDVALALWAGEGDFDVQTLRLVFPSEGGAPGAPSVPLKTTASFRITVGDRPVALELTGQAEVQIATARITALSLSGPATALARGPGEHPATGTGRLRITSHPE